MKMLGFHEGVGVCRGLGFYHGLLSTTLPTWVNSLQALPHQMTSHFGITYRFLFCFNNVLFFGFPCNMNASTCSQ